MKLRLVENDYAILRSFEGRCSFATFINIVVQRLVLDDRIHAWGKWHASAKAKRLGALAVELEQLVHRDGHTLDDAVMRLARTRQGITRESLETLLARLPARAPRPRDVALEEAAPVAITRGEAEENVLAAERLRTSKQVSRLIREAIAGMHEDDRLILQLRFEGGMSVAEIARSLRIEQKLLYRRIERCKVEMRRALERAGVDARDVLDLIGRDESQLEFHLGNLPPRPSMEIDETAAHPEDSR